MMIGAVFLAMNPAPTEEIYLIAYKMSDWQIVLLAILSLVVMHAFVYTVGFRGEEDSGEDTGFWSVFLRFTVVGYAISLCVSFYLLWVFGSIDGMSVKQMLDVFLYSPEEILRSKRFDAYTADELEEAKKFIGQWKWEFGERKLRRLHVGRTPHRLNIRGTIRKNIFPTQDFIELQWKERKTKVRPLVVLTDISGSMDHYTRILLHFIFTIYSVNKHIEAFTFGTRLTRITHYLRQKDVNDALDLTNDSVEDWSGGTKIGETLEAFNRTWARRVLNGGAVVLIISDGWDTGNIKLLKKEADRLHRSCHHIIWLNPNLGYTDFQPLTQGVQAILPHVDKFLPIHNLNSLIELGRVLKQMNKKESFKAIA